jgi:hypothetical protein
MSDTGGFLAGAIVGKLLLDKSGWDSSIKAIAKDESVLGGMFGNVGKSAQRMAVMAAAAVSAVTVAVLSIAKHTAQAGQDIYELSEKTGVSTEILSGWKLAADKAGSSLEGLALGFRFLGRNMVNTEGAGAFAKIGVQVKDLEGKFRPMSDVMLDVADRFAGMEQGALKTNLAIKIFGRSGSELIPMLNMGSAGLREQLQLAERLGIVFTEKTAKAADAYYDSLVDLRAGFQGIRNDIGNAIIPVLTQLSKYATEVIANIRERVKAFAESGQLKEWAISSARVFVGVFKVMVQAVEGLILILPTLKATFQGVWGWMQGKLADTVRFVAKYNNRFTGLFPGMTDFLNLFAESAEEQKNKFHDMAANNIKDIGNIYAGFDPLNQALDEFAAGLDGTGKIGKKTFAGIANASQYTAEELAKNIKELLADIDATPMFVEVPIEFDVDALLRSEDDVQIIIDDIIAEYSKGTSEAAKKIKDDMKALSPAGSLLDLRTELAMNKQALAQWGNSLPIWKVMELKQKISDAEYLLRDPTPWTMFKANFDLTLSTMLPQLNALVSQLSANETAALDNEYQKRLAYIEATVKDEEKKQKAIVALEAEYELKKSKARKKWAIAEKATAIAQAYIDASLAVIKVYSQTGIFGIPLAAIIKALCLAQIALIVAQPVEYATGAAFTQKTHVQNAVFGEAGPEYLLPEKKLQQIVREAFTSRTASYAPSMMAMAGAGGGGAVYIYGPLIHTTGISKRDIDEKADYLARTVKEKLGRAVGRNI